MIVAQQDQILPTYALITAPTVDVITLDEAKAHVRAVEFTDDDVWLVAATRAFAAKLDAQRGWLGRAMRPQTWEYRLDRFPRTNCRPYDVLIHRGVPAIELPFPPFISLTSLKYDDEAGVERTLVQDTDFKIVGVGSDQPVNLMPMYGGSWPTSRCAPESVRIRFQCGYAPEVTGAGAHPDLLPPEARLWVLANLATAYENRESTVLSKNPAAIPTISDDLVMSLRVHWFV